MLELQASTNSDERIKETTPSNFYCNSQFIRKSFSEGYDCIKKAFVPQLS